MEFTTFDCFLDINKENIKCLSNTFKNQINIYLILYLFLQNIMR